MLFVPGTYDKPDQDQIYGLTTIQSTAKAKMMKHEEQSLRQKAPSADDAEEDDFEENISCEAPPPLGAASPPVVIRRKPLPQSSDTP